VIDEARYGLSVRRHTFCAPAAGGAARRRAPRHAGDDLFADPGGKLVEFLSIHKYLNPKPSYNS
jgi:hypothetical protein